MCYIHTFEVDYKNSILLAYENNHKSGRLDFELQNENILKIIDFKSGCNDPNYYQGTKMILYLLNSIKVPIKRIHGVLSTEDAKTDGTNKWKNDVTENLKNNSVAYIDKLIVANNNCSFDIIINNVI